jgi:hypothetical protein
MAEEESPKNKQVNIEIGDINDVSGQVNVAAGHIVYAEKGATVIIGAQAEATSGLMALSELMQRSSEVRTAVIAFQTDFRVVREQVDRLGDYKDLHDLLHKLQFHSYSGIALAKARFPKDELILEILYDHALTLTGIVEELRQVAARPLMLKQDLSWIDEAGLAKEELYKAIDTLDEKLLKLVIWRLNRLLAKYPGRINILLNHSARALRLPALLNALKLICETLTSLDLDSHKMTAFQSGVDALGELDQILSALVDSHDHWQTLDDELRRIEGLIDYDLNEFGMSWPSVKLMARPLYNDCQDEWAKALKKESDTLDEVLNSNNQAKVREGFRRYQRRSTQRFYQVDVELKAVCDQMRQIGIPLASVLEMIG